MKQKTRSCLLLLLTLWLGNTSPLAAPAMSPVPAPLSVAEFDQVFERLKRWDVYSDKVDMAALRGQVLKEMRAGRFRDLGEALEFLADLMGDRHLSYSPPQPKWWIVDPKYDFGSGVILDNNEVVGFLMEAPPATRKALKLGDKLIRIDGIDIKETRRWKEYLRTTGTRAHQYVLARNGKTVVLTLPSVALSRNGEFDSRKVGRAILYINLPQNAGNLSAEKDNSNYLERFRTQVLNRITGQECGVVLDLRADHGGYSSPQLAIASLFSASNKDFLTFDLLDDSTSTVSMDARGHVRESNTWHGLISEAALDDIGYLKDWEPYVAVLTSSFTASAGEMVRLSFMQQPKARTFGETTSGSATDLQLMNLENGGILNFSSAFFKDRLSRVYPQGIAPDVQAKVEWKNHLNRQDLAFNAALNWLAQHNCN